MRFVWYGIYAIAFLSSFFICSGTTDYDVLITQTTNAFYTYVDEKSSYVDSVSVDQSYKDDFFSLVTTTSANVSTAYASISSPATISNYLTVASAVSEGYSSLSAELGKIAVQAASTSSDETASVDYDVLITQTVDEFYSYLGEQQAFIDTVDIESTSDKDTLASLIETTSAAVTAAYLAISSPATYTDLVTISTAVSSARSSINAQLSKIYMDLGYQTTIKTADSLLQTYSMADYMITQTVQAAFEYLDDQKNSTLFSALDSATKTEIYNLVELANSAIVTAYTISKAALDAKYYTALSNKEYDVTFYTQIAEVVSGIQNALEPIQNSVAVQTIAQQIEAQAVYKEQMQALWKELATDTAQYQSLKTQAQDFEAAHFASKTIDITTLNTIVQGLKAIVESLVSTYDTYGMPISYQDSSNFAIIVTNYILRLFFDDMGMERSFAVNEIAASSTRAQGFQRMYELSQRILGTQVSTDVELLKDGYNGQVDEIAAFFEADVQTDLLASYSSQRKLLMQVTLVDALQDLVLSYSAPTAEHITYGEAFFSLAVLDISEDQADTASALYRNLAALYITRGEVLLKALLPGQDNTEVINEVVTYFTNASDLLSQVGDTDTSNQFAALATNLSGALVAVAQGQSYEQSGDIASAISSYQQAQTYFINGGDQVDAGAITIVWTTLQAGSYATQGQELLNDALTQNKVTLQNYIMALNTLDPISDTENNLFDSAWQSLQIAANSVLESYGTALNDYQQVTVALEITGGDNYQGVMSSLGNALEFLATFSKTWDTIFRADTFAQLGTLDGINIAEELYLQAVDYGRSLDALYADDSNLGTYVPFYVTSIIDGLDAIDNSLVTGQIWNYETLITRHIAKIYIDTMTSAGTDNKTRAQYFADANGSRRKLLGTTVDTYLTTTLDEIREFWGNIEDVYFNAQAQQEIAEVQTSDAWVNSIGSDRYASVAENKWQQVLRLYRTGIILASPSATIDFVNASEAGYVDAAGKFAAAYLANVPEDFFPSLGAAMIYYRQYTVYQLNMTQNTNESFEVIPNVQTLSSQCLSTMNSLMETFFTQGSDFISETKDTTSLLATATQAQERLIVWKNMLETALIVQQDVLDQFFADELQAPYVFLKKEIDDDGNTIYTWVPNNLTITLSDPDLTLAGLYQSIAESSFSTQDYKTAYESYYLAWQLYTQLNKTTESSEMFSSYLGSLIKYYATWYQYSIIPNDKDQGDIPSRQVYSLTVPLMYMLNLYYTKVPSYLSFAADLSLASSSNIPEEQIAEITEEVVSLATLLYMDLKLQTVGFSFFDAFNEDLTIVSSLPDLLSEDVVDSILEAGQLYQSNLQARLDAGISKLYLAEVSGSYYLYQTYLPILAVETPSVSAAVPTEIPLKKTPYSGFPIALGYYEMAQTYYAPGASLVSIGGVAVPVPLSNQDEAAKQAVYNLIGQAYVSDAADYQSIIDYITTGENKEAVQAIVGLTNLDTLDTLQTTYAQMAAITDMTDSSIDLSSYMTLYYILKSYYLDVINFQLAFAQDNYSQGLSTEAASLQSEIGDVLFDAAQALKAFLLGDPLSDEYYLLLQDQRDIIVMIYSVYLTGGTSQEIELFNYLAGLYRNAANILVGQEKYFSAVTFYLDAIGLYNLISQPDTATQTAITETYVELLRAMVTGSVNNLSTYQIARNEGVTYVSSSGAESTVDFQTLLSDFQQWGVSSASGILYGSGMDSNELQAYTDLQSSVLDSLIELTGGYQYALQPVSSSETASLTAQSLIATYTKNAGIDFETIEGTDALFALSESELKSFLLNPFEQFAAAITSSTSTTTQDANFYAIASWIGILNQFYTGLYVNDFLAGAEDAWSEFESEMSDEVQNILAPASSYV